MGRTNRIMELFKPKKVNRQYKDLLFRYVFQDKKSLMNLYNALNQSNYTDESELEIILICRYVD